MSHPTSHINRTDKTQSDITSPGSGSSGTSGKEVTFLASGLLILAIGIGGALMYSQEEDLQVQSAQPVDTDQLSNAFHSSTMGSESNTSTVSSSATIIPVSMTKEDPQATPASMMEEKEVYFGFDQAVLSDEAKTLLQDQAQQFGDEQNWNVLVQGHTDEKGSDSYNQALSLRRATVVKEYLANQGISTDAIQIEGLGKTEAICSESTDACWAQNRRARVVFLKTEVTASHSQPLMTETSSESANETTAPPESITEIAESDSGSPLETVQLSEPAEEVMATDQIEPVTSPE